MWHIEFAGWYYDEQFTRPVLDSDRLTTNSTIYARFAEITEPEPNIWRWLAWVIAGLAVVGVLAIIYFVFRKKKKRGKW